MLTPQNSALIIIDNQPVQVNSIASMDRQLLVNNITGVAKIGLTYGLPVVHSTANVKAGHWHGAAKDSRMSHLAIAYMRDGKNADWKELVTDEQYNTR